MSTSLVRIKITKGNLPGYTLKKSVKERRAILEELAKKDSWGTIVKRLNVLYIYNKNRYPETASKFRRDMKYIQRKFSPKKKSMKKRKRKTMEKEKLKKISKEKRKMKTPKKTKTKRKRKSSPMKKKISKIMTIGKFKKFKGMTKIK